jgi:hypothetical protein
MGEEARGLMPSDEGKRRLRDTGSVRPFARGEGRRTVAPGAVAQLTQRRRLGCLKVGEDLVGPVVAKRPEQGQLRVENKSKNNWAAQGVLGRNRLWAADRNRNYFLNFELRNWSSNQSI